MKYLITVLFLFFLKTTFGQAVYEPQILILAPNVTTYENGFENDIAKANEEIRKKANIAEMEQFVNSPRFREEPENLQIMDRNVVDFFKDIDFFKQANFTAHETLASNFFGRFKNLMIRHKDAKAGNLADLKMLSETEKLQYVLNFASISLYKENNVGHVKITVQFYDNITNTILLDKSYTGDRNTPGIIFGCEGTILCSLRKALEAALDDIVNIIKSNSPTLKRDKQLKEERSDVLVKHFLSRPFDKKSIDSIISPEEKNIKTAIAYQVLFNEEKSKFVAFFLNRFRDQDNKDTGYLATLENTEAYIVKGVRYNDKWYYEQANGTYFRSKTLKEAQQEFYDNLQWWNFFKDDSVELNPEFWETKLFNKVVDLKLDPDWTRFGELIWKAEEINNRPYIGFYEFVAKQLMDERREFFSVQEEKISKTYLEPLAGKLKKQLNDFRIIDRMAFILIYPKDMHVILCPIQVKENGKGTYIRYFVLLKQEDNSYKVYEWVYLNPDDFIAAESDPEVEKQISTLTAWDEAVDTLEDDNFWSNYVLAKSDGNFKYLQEVK